MDATTSTRWLWASVPGGVRITSQRQGREAALGVQTSMSTGEAVPPSSSPGEGAWNENDASVSRHRVGDDTWSTKVVGAGMKRKDVPSINID